MITKTFKFAFSISFAAVLAVVGCQTTPAPMASNATTETPMANRGTAAAEMPMTTEMTPELSEIAGEPAAAMPPQDGKILRYLAWVDGDLQTGYQQIDRTIAESRLAELQANPPKPTQTDDYLEYLSLLDASGKHTDAEKKIKSYLAEHPNEKRAVFLIAVHYWRLQKKELAAYFFNQLEKDANFPWKSLLYNNLGMLALQDKNRSAAIGYFEKATQSAPSSAAPYVNLGALYLQSRSYAEAEKVFAKARDIDDAFEDAALGLGVSLEGQGKFEESHQVYTKFIEGHANAMTALYNDSVLLGNRLNQKELAAQQLLRYIQRGGKETARAQEIIQSWR